VPAPFTWERAGISFSEAMRRAKNDPVMRDGMMAELDQRRQSFCHG
jgi:hypothetical protein